MTAPTLDRTKDGATDAAGAWVYDATGLEPSVAHVGHIIILQVLQDGPTSGAVALTGISSVASLDGTHNAMDFIGEFQVGGTNLARQYLWIGRFIDQAASASWQGTNSTSEDLYFRAYEFADCSAGTTLATVIENGSAGSTVSTNGTANTADMPTVETLGPDRLALACIAVNDDNVIGTSAAGETGGSWAEVAAAYAESSGTDGAIQVQSAAMATAGTISGGSVAITASDAWGVVGFALIGTTPDAPRVPRFTPYPQLLPR